MPLCPCCRHEAQEFQPFGVVQRRNARCPSCGSLERHRLLWLFLTKRTRVLESNLRLLHLAPESVFARLLGKLDRLQYVTADLASAAAVRLDVTALPFLDDTFDAILCNHVLEHVTDDGAAMRELRRVLKPGSWAILQSPIDRRRERTYENPAVIEPADREREFGQFDHVRVYGRDYGARLTRAGFRVEAIPYAEELGPALVHKYALRSEPIYFCSAA
jgi:SAM-dependent methyltransferase